MKAQAHAVDPRHALPPAALRALLAHSIDYAGLFPPTTLPLEPALKNYAAYLRTPETWMLSTFVLPIAKFGDAAWLVSEFAEERPLRISALGPRTLNAIDFREELKTAIKVVHEFSAQYEAVMDVTQLEMALPSDEFAPLLWDEIREVIGDVPVRAFWEATPDAAPRIIQQLAEHNARSGALPFGFKLRTGGVTSDAFPTSALIAKALIASARNKVPIKFTAGLHHPIRMFRNEVDTKMHGFLNVLSAGVLCSEHGWSERQTVAVLEDEDIRAFSFDEAIFRWREFEIGSAEIEKHRKLIMSFGSCSFDEPRDDLRALKLL